VTGTFPSHLGLDGVLSQDTRTAWTEIRPYLPRGTYLAGGTGIAVHLKHRVSNDLDFFTDVPLDVDELNEALVRSPLMVQVTRATSKLGSLAGVLRSTKFEFSDASAVHRVEPTTEVAGIPVAGVGDLLAMKVKAITARKELRDYEDLKALELLAGRRFEEGIALAIERYTITTEGGVMAFITALANIDRCGEDPLVVTPRDELIAYWKGRLPAVVASVSRYAVRPMSPDEANDAIGFIANEENNSKT
jgi:hypothetical protein